MASYIPPLEDLPIFDDLVFTNLDQVVTVDYANKHYLRYPIAQGTETLQTTIINGTTTCNNNLTVNAQVDVESNLGLSSNPMLKLRETQSNQSTLFVNNAPAGAYNPMTQFGDNLIFTQNTTTPGATGLDLTIWGNNYCGVRITDNDVVVGAGGNVNVPTTSVETNGNTGIVTVTAATPAIYGPSTVQPAVTDSSTKIPSTAWVQSVLTSPQMFHFRTFNCFQTLFWTTTPSPTPTYASLSSVNCTGTWDAQDYVILRITTRIAWTTDNTGSENAPWQYTAGTMGEIMLRPAAMPAGNFCPLGTSNMCYGTTSGTFYGPGNVIYYTPYSSFTTTGNNNALSSFCCAGSNNGGSRNLQFAPLSPLQGQTQQWGNWLTIEITGSYSAGGTVTIVNGSQYNRGYYNQNYGVV